MRVLVIGLVFFVSGLAACGGDDDGEDFDGSAGAGPPACSSLPECSAEATPARELTASAAELGAAAEARYTAIRVACSALGETLGVSADALVGDPCGEAIGALIAERAGAPSSFDADAQCGVSAAFLADCEDQCRCGSCGAREACLADEPTWGTCPGLCERCAASAEVARVDCSGNCAGRCAGTCDDAAIDEAVCDGTCVGTCAGVCTQAPDDGIACAGDCLAGCDVPLDPVHCGSWASDAPSCACAARCDRRARFEASCTRIGFADPVVEPAVEYAERELLQICGGLPAFVEVYEQLDRESREIGEQGQQGFYEATACLDTWQSLHDADSYIDEMSRACVSVTEVSGG